MKGFIAIDGEAIDGRYVLLCSSDNTSAGKRSVFNIDGLTTRECFDFLIGTAERGKAVVCFGLNYDSNNWLINLPRPILEELWTHHYAYVGNYRIEWLPGRWFSLTRSDSRYVKVTETFGFFQSSFVAACKAWGFEPGGELEAMKKKRGSFTPSDQRRVTEYCHAECDLLVQLMGKLAASCAEAEATPSSWIGAGAIASSLLAKQGVADHHAHDLDITTADVATDVVLGAYFGGRVELLKQGVTGNVKTADVRSAYPHAATLLPSLAGGRLVHRSRYKPEAEHAIWRVSWENLQGAVMPFPVRVKKAIWYPRSGSGWYHACEVRAAQAAGFPVRVHEGYVLQPARASVGAQPFGWVPVLFAQRARWQKAGNPAQKALKLGLNSLYGKLAQGYGYKNKAPRWQSYFWAGEITARTRARLLTVAAQARAPIMLATDGVFGAPTIRGADRLGGWELGKLDWLFTAQPGVYQAFDDTGKEVLKSRGFFAREVDYDVLRDGWESEGAEYVHTYKSTRFVGLGTALHRTDFGVWRQWVTESRSLSLSIDRKISVPDGRGGNVLLPPPGPLQSEPYEPKISLLDARALDTLQGGEQPLRDTI